MSSQMCRSRCVICRWCDVSHTSYALKRRAMVAFWSAAAELCWARTCWAVGGGDATYMEDTGKREGGKEEERRKDDTEIH